jgi:AmmeMemoRadiSam system protein A
MQSMTIDAADRHELLTLARHSIELGLAQERLAPAPIVSSPMLRQHRATFVTLNAHRDLRGCCGSIEPRLPLAEDVWRNAWASAFADPRFPPLTRDEYPALDLHISVLSPLERVRVASEQELLAVLRPNRDGLMLARAGARATFLPSVWESLEDPVQFVRQLKLKAGWRPDFWAPDVEVWRYETESFGEAEH